MSLVWIAHESSAVRAAVERQLVSGTRVRSGDPGDAAFDRAEAPAAVVLGADDLEVALDFAHRHAPRAGQAHWLVLHDRRLPAAGVAHLFGSGLRLSELGWPASPSALRNALCALSLPATPTLSARLRRDALEHAAQPFFADLRIPQLEDAPAIADRILVRGETGTGRLLLARLLHLRSRAGEDAFAVLAGDESSRPEELVRAVGAVPRGAGSLTLCVQDADRLPPETQRWLRAWIEVGAGPDLGRPVRWLATAGPEGASLEPDLETCLGHEVIELAPLRERSELIEPFALVTAAAWARRRGVEPPEVTPEALYPLRDLPWLGNLRELEGVLTRAFARRPGEPLGPGDLFELPAQGSNGPRPSGETGWPAEAEEPAHPRFSLVDDAPLSDADDALDALGADPDPLPEPELVVIESETRSEAPKPTVPAEGSLLPRLAAALAHEVRNPLVALRTFATLAPEQAQDAELRRFGEQVQNDVGRIESLLERLIEFSHVGVARSEPVDATGLLETLLEQKRPAIQARRLLVLQELDPTRPLAMADPDLLRTALEALLRRTLEWVPERADLFVASKHHPIGRDGGPTVQILLRFYSPERPSSEAAAALALESTSVDVILAEHLVRLQGGELRFERGQPDETVVRIDLPAQS